MSEGSKQNLEESGGFFSRWSQRKQAVKQGAPLAEPLPKPQEIRSEPRSEQRTDQNGALATSPNKATGAKDQIAQTPEPVKALTLEDVAKLTPESDFTSYMTQGVSPEVRNAAMKKLLADPHYNIMDGLDIYIGDYNTPDPMPEGMLAKMVGAQFLGLVKAPEDVAQSTSDEIKPQNLPELVTEQTKDDPPQNAAHSSSQDTSSNPLENDPASHDHTHLRLQSDHASADPKTGSGAG
jgi:hypothetical protein